MKNHDDYARALRRTLVALAICAALVAIGYFFVDRPVAFWVHDHQVNQHLLLKQITLVPPLVETWAPLVIVFVIVRRAFGTVTKLEWALLAAAVALIVADQFRESLSAVFGRYWPQTWRDDNPSLIANGAYGFHWFHTGDAYGSFPSGHMARTVAAAAVFWVAYPRKAVHVAAIGLSLLMAISLIGMNYHFASDVIAGSFVGAIVGAYAATLCGLASRAEATKGRTIR